MINQLTKSKLWLTLALTTTVSIASASAASYTESTVTNGGTITGKVSFSGTDPDPVSYSVAKDIATCGSSQRILDFVRVKNGGLNDAVVYLANVKSGKAFPTLNGNLEQKGCKFLPYLSVMHNNDSVDAVNSDPVMHNIHTYELISAGNKFAKKTAFNVSQPKIGTVTKTIDMKRGNGMKVECDAHDFMHAFVFVAKNPYYAVVKQDGTFSIDNVPPGDYKIMAWHGTLGEEKGNVTVTESGNVSFNFEYK